MNEASNPKVTKSDIESAAERLKNWGKWGPDDHIGTLNYTLPSDIVNAAQLVRKGQVISLALNYDSKGPQGGKTKFPPVGRFNPVHTMLRTGTDAYSGVLDKRGIRSADDIVLFPLQAGTHWDGLGHILRRQHVERLRLPLRVLLRSGKGRHRTYEGENGRARRAARHCEA